MLSGQFFSPAPIHLARPLPEARPPWRSPQALRQPTQQQLFLYTLQRHEHVQETQVGTEGCLAHQWSVKANCLFSQIKPDFLGVEIAVPGKLAGRQLSDIPDNAKTLAQLLTDAQIPFTLGAEGLVKEEKDVMLFVGNGPRP